MNYYPKMKDKIFKTYGNLCSKNILRKFYTNQIMNGLFIKYYKKFMDYKK
jgi:hypothetical protein